VKVDELRVLEEDELGTRLKTARRELYELRFKSAVGQLENSSQIAKARHDIARILTVLNERELGISTIQEAAPVEDPAVATPKKSKPKRKEFEDEEDEATAAEATVAEPAAEAEAEPAEEVKPKRGRRAKAEKDAKAAKE
jgi:large subunit ribosomal protein L29